MVGVLKGLDAKESCNTPATRRQLRLLLERSVGRVDASISRQEWKSGVEL